MADEAATTAITFKINVHTLSEHLGSCTDHAVVEITPELAARIRELNQAVLKLRAYVIQEWDCHPDFFMGNDFMGNGYRLDGYRLVVSDDDFRWHGWYKHSDELWETGTIPLSVLDAEPGSVHDLRQYKAEDEEPDPGTDVQEGGAA